MATLTTHDGTRIFYEVRGEGRPPFVFIHGWCANLHHWDAQVRHFGARHRVLAVDRRGHGRSDVPGGGYSAKQHAADLAEVAGQEDMQSAIVVGHAGGGPATLEFARAYPHLARAVVMVEAIVSPKARLGDPEDPSGWALAQVIDRLESNDGAAAFESMYREFFSEHAGPPGEQAIADAITTPLDVAVKELRSLAIDTESIARQLDQPVLWLTVTAADQERVGGVFGDVQFGQVVGSGHFPHLEVPEQTNAMIDRFVSNL